MRPTLLLTALPLLALARTGSPPVRIVVTPNGDILINSGFEYSVNEIRSRMKVRGFRFYGCQDSARFPTLTGRYR